MAIGALFGLYDWKFEVMGLLYHTIDLEKRFDGVGPHTISFPRLEPEASAPISKNSPYKVSDRDFKRLVTVIRLSVPYTGMILTDGISLWFVEIHGPRWSYIAGEMPEQPPPTGVERTELGEKIGLVSDSWEKLSECDRMKLVKFLKRLISQKLTRRKSTP